MDFSDGRNTHATLVKGSVTAHSMNGIVQDYDDCQPHVFTSWPYYLTTELCRITKQ